MKKAFSFLFPSTSPHVIFNDENFFKKMMRILNDYQIKAKYVELEVTETVLMENPEMSRSMLEKIRQ